MDLPRHDSNASDPDGRAEATAGPVHPIGAIPECFWQAARSGALGRLAPGETLELAADADPVAGWNLLRALLPGRYTWRSEAVAEGGFRIAIGRQM